MQRTYALMARTARCLLLPMILLALAGCADSELPPELTIHLDEEFSWRDKTVDSFDAYLQLEDRLFEELDEQIYARNPTGPDYAIDRYSRGSLADPEMRQPNWNRSFELTSHEARGGVLLLHGLSDSPYSLRAIAERLQQQGYHVIGPRMPGHGTAPTGLLDLQWQDMTAVTELAMQHLAQQVPGQPLHIIGYSTGAALALDYVLRAHHDTTLQGVSSLVLYSPAIGISPEAVLASWLRRLSHIPGLGSLAWLDIAPEFDPYKYNSFATNGAEQVRSLTNSVARRIAALADKASLPPILALKSTVDATVSNTAVVDRLLGRLAAGRNEMVLFDINRFAVNRTLLGSDPGPFTQRMLKDHHLPFTLTLIANSNPDSRSVSAVRKASLSSDPSDEVPLASAWPPGVFSLSHIAVPFPPEDPLYGEEAPEVPDDLFLGKQAVQGEKGVLKISADFLLRLRYNPFYPYLERRTLQWLQSHTIETKAPPTD
ncbi:MAG: alpha/beta hydrolase [Pseudomonadota bacterium]